MDKSIGKRISDFVMFVIFYSFLLLILLFFCFSSRLLILATSYVPVIYGTRTLSNCLEMAFMSLLLYLVADCMIVSDKVCLTI